MRPTDPLLLNLQHVLSTWEHPPSHVIPASPRKKARARFPSLPCSQGRHGPSAEPGAPRPDTLPASVNNQSSTGGKVLPSTGGESECQDSAPTTSGRLLVLP